MKKGSASNFNFEHVLKKSGNFLHESVSQILECDTHLHIIGGFGLTLGVYEINLRAVRFLCESPRRE